MDADPVQVNPAVPCPQLLYCIFLVLEAVVAEIAVAVVVVPFGPVRMTAPVAHGYDNEPELSQPVGPRESSAPRNVVGFHLRTRIYVIAYRIDLCGIEIKWFVDGAVEIGYTICRLDLEPLRELVTRSEKKREVSLAEVAHFLSGRIEKRRSRFVVHAGIIGNEILAVVRGYRVNVHVRNVEHLRLAALQTHPVNMHLIWILALFLTAGAEQDIALLFIDSEHVIHMVCPFGKVSYQCSVSIVEIEVRPSVALGPMNQFPSTIQKPCLSAFHVSVHPLRNHGLGRIAVHTHVADVHAFQVTAHTGKIEPVVVSEPTRTVELIELVVGSTDIRLHDEVLILERIDLHLPGGPVRGRKYVQMALRSRLSRHLVFVSLQCRTWLSQ